jgi:hypothetical protein
MTDPRNQPDRPELFQQLANAVTMCSAEDQVIWAIFGTFWATNAILLVALFSTGELPKSPAVGIAVSAVGAGLSIVWHLIQQRALGHLQRFEELVELLEKRLQVPTDLALSAKVNTSAYTRFLSKGVRARKLMVGCSLASTLLWAGALIYFVIGTCRA